MTREELIEAILSLPLDSDDIHSEVQSLQNRVEEDERASRAKRS